MTIAHKEAQAARVLAQLTIGHTQKELRAIVRMQHCEIVQACTTLTARKLIHIAGYTDKRARIYLVGDCPDAAKPDDKIALLKRWTDKVLDVIEIGDITSAELIEKHGMTYRAAQLALRHLRAAGQIHICEYSGNTNSERTYRLGYGVDAKPRAVIIREATKRALPPPDPISAAFFGR